MNEQEISNANKRWLALIHALILLSIFLLFIFQRSLRLSEDKQYTLWVIILILSFIWIVWSWYKIKKDLFNPYGLFLLAVFLFNISLPLLSLIPGNDSVSLNSLFPTGIVNLTLAVTTFSILGLHMGALIAANFVSRKKTEKRYRAGDRELAVVGYLLILISLYPIFLTTKESIQLSLDFGYNSLYRQSIGTGVLAGPSILANFIVPGVLFLLASSKSNKKNRLLSFVIICTYTISQLILGKRSIAIMPLIAYLWLWHKTIKPIKIGYLTSLAAFFLFLIFPIIRLSRSIIGIERFSWQTITDLLSASNPVIDIFNEMGGTMNTIAHTVQLVPTTRAFDLGTSYLYSLTTAIPNFFWDTHPVITHGTLSNWLVWIIDPVFARANGSFGYSFIAEAYLNFGAFGAIFILGLIGFLFIWFSEHVETSGNKALLVVLASYTSFFLFFARSESYAIIRPFVWYSMLPLAIYFLLSKLRGANG